MLLLCIPALFAPTIGLKAGGREDALLQLLDPDWRTSVTAMFAHKEDAEVQKTGCDSISKQIMSGKDLTGAQAQQAMDLMAETALRMVDNKDVALTCLKPLARNMDIIPDLTKGLDAVKALMKAHHKNELLHDEDFSTIYKAMKSKSESSRIPATYRIQQW